MKIRYCLLKDKKIPLDDFVEFNRLVPIYLKDIEKKYGVEYESSCINLSHLHIILATSELTNKIFNNNESIDFSWTNLGCDIIMINYDNWKHKYLEPNKKINNLYKKYVVLHEFLHASPFNFGHLQKNCNTNGGYNVMYQQTRNAVNIGGKLNKKCINNKIVLPDLVDNELKMKINKMIKRQEEIFKEKYRFITKIQKTKLSNN